MADVKISALPASTTPLAGTEVLPIVQSGVTKKTSIESVLTSVQPSGTANGVAYLNGSKVLTTGSALQFDGSNLGLGVTPSAWGSPFRALQVGNGTGLSGRTDTSTLYLSSNWFNNGSNDKYAQTGNATLYLQNVGQHIWYTAPSGTAGNTISFTQAMTLDASGNLFVGTTGGNYGGYSKSLTLSGSSTFGIEFVSGGALSGYLASYSGTELRMGTQSTQPLTFHTNNTERARIDSSGNLLVGITSPQTGTAADPAGISLYGPAAKGTGVFARNGTPLYVNNKDASGQLIQFYCNGNIVGDISSNGTTTSYNTSSDYRLKNTITPMTGALAKVALLKPCTYKWNADGSDGEGFIAHELAEVVPQCVTGEKDAVDAEGNPKYQGIDTSFLVATLTAAIQELKAEFDAYKATHP
jgi:hypothetical protein